MIRTMAMPNSFLVLFVRVLDKFSEKKLGQLQRKVGKFLYALSIITDNRSYICICLMLFFCFQLKKKSGRFEEKPGKTRNPVN
jgi:hypothetical protein